LLKENQNQLLKNNCNYLYLIKKAMRMHGCCHLNELEINFIADMDAALSEDDTH